MIIVSNNQSSNKLFAVSFDTATYQDLQYFVQEHAGYSLERIDPNEFLNTQQALLGSYINLVIADVALRKQITAHLDQYNLNRFSMVHDQSYALPESVALGCMIYPMASIYPSATLEQDVIVHSLTLIAHKCHVGRGAFISGGITIGGSTTIGDFTQIGINSTLYDQINIVANTVIGAATVVRKDISQSGTYSSQLKNNLTRIK